MSKSTNIYLARTKFAAQTVRDKDGFIHAENTEYLFWKNPDSLNEVSAGPNIKPI